MLYSVKMRASQEENGTAHHISGAEKIVTQEQVELLSAQLVARAMHHPKGVPTSIHLKVEALKEEAILRLPALPVTTKAVGSKEEGRKVLSALLTQVGLQPERILPQLKKTYGMRGAMLLDVRTGKRLEPDYDRGVRATYMDADSHDMQGEKAQGSHFREALVLASKVAHCPQICGEICISDDPDYVTGYFASQETGYVRITKLKEMGDHNGGRIFLYCGKPEEVAECIAYLQEQPVLVEGVPFIP